jgi:hypothetical protein
MTTLQTTDYVLLPRTKRGVEALDSGEPREDSDE